MTTDAQPGELAREMVMAHRMFRREFGLAAEVVRRVAVGEVDRAGAVADHLRFIAALLHHHHAGEDDYIWPLLLERALPQANHIHDVERQHRSVDSAVQAVIDAVDAWTPRADATTRDVLARALEALSAVVGDHMDVIAAMAGGIDPKDLMLAIGMTTYEGDDETVEATMANLPPEVGPNPRATGRDAYARHAEAIYGTGTPPRSDELARSH